MNIEVLEHYFELKFDPNKIAEINFANEVLKLYMNEFLEKNFFPNIEFYHQMNLVDAVDKFLEATLHELIASKLLYAEDSANITILMHASRYGMIEFVDLLLALESTNKEYISKVDAFDLTAFDRLIMYDSTTKFNLNLQLLKKVTQIFIENSSEERLMKSYTFAIRFEDHNTALAIHYFCGFNFGVLDSFEGTRHPMYWAYQNKDFLMIILMYNYVKNWFHPTIEKLSRYDLRIKAIHEIIIGRKVVGSYNLFKTNQLFKQWLKEEKKLLEEPTISRISSLTSYANHSSVTLDASIYQKLRALFYNLSEDRYIEHMSIELIQKQLMKIVFKNTFCSIDANPFLVANYSSLIFLELFRDSSYLMKYHGFCERRCEQYHKKPRFKYVMNNILYEKIKPYFLRSEDIECLYKSLLMMNLLSVLDIQNVNEVRTSFIKLKDKGLFQYHPVTQVVIDVHYQSVKKPNCVCV